ncbi:MAG TPA: M50 family metallopeptidase [Candidatus Saccharibacteria bacterium]|nr:M50 family metallopeptidase [Candidatus Saccharibacteria bacterium]
MGILTGLIVLVVLIVVHELGHAIVARRNGVVVEEFGIGFPPKAWGKKLKNGVLFTLNWLPLGGFVRLKGEHDAAKGKGTYGAATFWQKTKILFAGVVMNWLVAVVLFTILALFGLPKIIPNQFVMAGDGRVEASPLSLVTVVEGSAAAKAGFEKGDVIISVDDTLVTASADFIAMTRKNAGETVKVTYERNGQTHATPVSLGDDPSKGVFGAVVGQSETIHASWSAPIVGVVTTGQLSWETLQGIGGLLGKLVSGTVQQFSGNEATRDAAKQKLDEVSNSVAGPVGILGVIFPSAQQQGIGQVVLLTAVISLTLAVMNALPIPALDGGRWWTMAVFRVLRKKLTKEREETIQGIGMLVLFGLIILITVSDVLKLW